MAAVASAEVIAELERTVHACPPARRAAMLRQIAELLLARADLLGNGQLAIFDEILIRLIDHVDVQSLAHLSDMLAELGSARLEITRRLAWHEEAAVAAPILQRSGLVLEAELIEIAECRGPAHALAISKRRQIDEALTDILLKQGDTNVCVQLAKNGSAQFSHNGYSKLAAMAERDDELADLLVSRPDVPAELLRELLTRLPRSVRARLLRIAAPQLREVMRTAIEVVEARICAKAPEPVDYSEAMAKVGELNKLGRLNDSTVNRFAVWHEYRNLVAALSQLAAVPLETIEEFLHEADCYGLIVACRAARLNWTTTLAVISNKPDQSRLSEKNIEQAKEAFEALNLSAAQRLIRFGSIRDFALKLQSSNDPSLAGVV